MKRLTLTIVALGLAGTLAACGKKAEEPVAAVPVPAPADSMASTPGAPGQDAMASMSPATPPTAAKGVGTVTAINEAAGTITIDHGPIAEVNWPAMTMAFKADHALLEGVKVGDKVAFDLKLADGAGEVTAIQKQ